MLSPWNGGQQQLALLQVRGLVEQDHRVAPDDRLEDPRALAGVQHVGWRLEHLLDLARGRRASRTAGEPSRRIVKREP